VRLWGGTRGPNNSKGTGGVSVSSLPKGTKSNQGQVNGFLFKNILKGKNFASTTPNQTHNIPNPYIVEQLNQILTMNVDLLETNDLCTTYISQGYICRFNSFWPKPVDLFQWIFTNWTINCEIHLFSTRFFIVKFASSEDHEYIL